MMIWKKNIYDTLTSCSTLCNEFATECSNSDRLEECYRSIFISLDCADLCRNLAASYVRGSANARLMANACIDVCEECAKEVSQFDTERSRQVYAMCKQTICSCVNIIDMGSQIEFEAKGSGMASSSSFYGTDAREPLYN